jgi:hypothetical protein
MTERGSFYRQQVAAHTPQPAELEERVVGVTFENRQAVVARLRVGDLVTLRREPRNPFDGSAIRVDNAHGEQIGYLRRELAAQLAPAFDRLAQPVSARVCLVFDVTPSGRAWGVRIRFAPPAPVRSWPAPENFD